MNPNYEAARAFIGESASQLNQKLDTNTKRMAGAALLAALAPGGMALVDNQEEDLAGYIGSGLVTGAGLGLGGYAGYKQGNVTPEQKDAYIRTEMEEIKKNMKDISREKGVEAGIEYAARAKQKLVEDIEPILSQQRAAAFNQVVKQVDPTGVIGEINIGSRTPRELRHMGRGAAIGGAAALLPAYALLRGGEIEE